MGVNFIDSTNIHGIDYDFDTKRSTYAHHTEVTSGMYNDGANFTYHMHLSAYPGNTSTVRLYDPAATIYYNENLQVLDPPTMSNEENAIRCIDLSNTRTSTQDVAISVFNNQPNYTMDTANYSEYMMSYNTVRYHTRTARVSLSLGVRFTRKTGIGLTPMFDSSKPIARILSLFDISVYDSARTNFAGTPVFVGPTYVLGSGVYWTASTGWANFYPYRTRRNHVYEMMFWIDSTKYLDESDPEHKIPNPNYGCIYLVNNNCKSNSLYHIARSTDEVRGFPAIEVSLKTTLYVTFE